MTELLPYEIITPEVSVEKDRIEWLKARRLGIGSSDCSIVLSVQIPDIKTYRSRWQLWRDKTGRVPLEDAGDIETAREYLYWGSRMELLTRPEVEIRYGVTVRQLPMLRSIERPWQLASLDGITDEDDPGIVELKNASEWMSAEWDDQVPDHAELQVQHDMAVTGASHAIVAGLIGGNKFRHRVIERSDKLISIINEAEEEFWYNNVLADVEPDVDGSEGTFHDLLEMSGTRDEWRELSVDGAVEAEELIAEYADAARTEKDGKSRKALARNKLMRIMDGAPGLTDEGGNELVRLKGATYAWKKFESDNPDVAELYMKKVEVLDTAAVRAEVPELAAKYQSKSIHIPKGE